MSDAVKDSGSEATRPSWRTTVLKYQTPNLPQAIWQIFNSFVPYFLMLYLMYRSIEISYLLTLALVLPAVGFVTRIFIIQHDCGHGSFFRSSRANDVLGSLCGVFTFTPYYMWRHSHAIHHATAGNLERRGVGDVITMTVREYKSAPIWRRFGYRMYRHPFFMFGMGGMILFLVVHRFSPSKEFDKDRWSVYGTNLAILAIVLTLGFTIGFTEYLSIQVPLLFCMSVVGMWMFYVQHQFEETYWERDEAWSYAKAAERGSSHYKLPKVLQWMTGNIGLHHIHHLNPRIANYSLQRCQDDPDLGLDVHTLTLRTALRSLRMRLWDEEKKRMVGFRDIRNAN